jgi:hypothetical protein
MLFVEALKPYAAGALAGAVPKNLDNFLPSVICRPKILAKRFLTATTRPTTATPELSTVLTSLKPSEGTAVSIAMLSKQSTFLCIWSHEDSHTH